MDTYVIIAVIVASVLAIGSNPDISLRDMYYTLARNTSGSHVKVYNDKNYGSVYKETMTEYLD